MMRPFEDTMGDTAAKVGDAIAVATVGAVLLQWLPVLAAGLTIIWTLIRIYETRTVQGWIAKWRKK